MTGRVQPRLRDLTSADLARILEITRATKVFRDEELLIAEEVARDCVNYPGATGGAAVESVTGSSGATTEGRPHEGARTESGGGDKRATTEGRPYYALGAELEGKLVGWVCWGSTPCTEGTWDLYWLAVDPTVHRSGAGSALVDEMERRLKGRARLISVDTSGRADYEPTRRFYLAKGYAAVAVVPDFYAPGDDQVIFTKRL